MKPERRIDSSEFVNNISTCGLEVAYDKLKRHTWNWAKSNLKDATTEGVLKAFGGSKLSSLCMSADPYTLYEWGY